MSKANLEGKRIGYIVRVSTERQEGNWSTVEQEASLLRRIRELGAQPIPYDEGAVSGRDLSKRSVALQMLADIDAGEIQGIAAYDLKRLSRDEYGADAQLILKRLARRRAVLVLHNGVIRPWDKDDRFLYGIQALLAGRDLVDIRDTFWRGLFARAANEGFFMGTPPLGYATEVVAVPSPRGDRTKLKRVPRKEIEHADLLTDLATWFDECASLGEVAKRFNERYPGRLPDVGRPLKHGTLRVLYSSQLRAMLVNPIYWGEFSFGRHGRHENSVWDIDSRRERASEFVQHDDRLAYWTRAQAIYWLRKFSRREEGRPVQRMRKHEHPLLGALSCAACGRVMTGGGVVGYRCPGSNDQRCNAPQTISYNRAKALARAMLPGIIAAMREHIERGAADQEATPDGGLAGKKRELTIKREQLAALNEDWYGAEAIAAKLRPPLDVRQRMSRLAEEIERLEGQVADAATEAEVAQLSRQKAEVALLMDDPATVVAEMSDEEVCYVFRTFVRDVRIRGHGHAGSRRHAVEGAYTLQVGTTAVGTETEGNYWPYSSKVLQEWLTFLQRITARAA